MNRSSPWVLVSAGEVSGDRIAAPVVQSLLKKRPGLRFFGIGGPRLSSAGVELLHGLSAAVTGFTDPLLHASHIARMAYDVVRQAHRRKPALALLVDYPGFNLRLASILKFMGVPILYYVAPQRWAWLGFRVHSLRRKLDRLAVILPFEEPWFVERGINATFVGHPLVDQIGPGHDGERARSMSAGDRPILALMPGSRQDEIRRHLPLLKAAASLLEQDFLPLVVSLPGETDSLCHQIAPDLRQAESSVALSAASVALCASGTATLETAMAGVPGVVFYRMSRLTYAVARRLVSVPHISLPNLILDSPLLPELIQDAMTPSRLAAETRRMVEPRVRARVLAGLRQVTERLGEPGVAERVSDMALDLLSEHP